MRVKQNFGGISVLVLMEMDISICGFLALVVPEKQLLFMLSMDIRKHQMQIGT